MIKTNWFLTFFIILGVILLASLGFWQLQRAETKQLLLESYAKRTRQEPLTGNQLNPQTDLQFYQVKLTGEFDEQHIFLLDNKTFHQKIGYEVYVPFHFQALPYPILVDLGFVEMGRDRRILPHISLAQGKISLHGMLNLSPRYVALGEMRESLASGSHTRIEYVNLRELEKLLHQKLFPYVLQIHPQDPQALPIAWQIVTISPLKHRGYALQWFALSLTLLISCLVLKLRKNRDK